MCAAPSRRVRRCPGSGGNRTFGHFGALGQRKRLPAAVDPLQRRATTEDAPFTARMGRRRRLASHATMRSTGSTSSRISLDLQSDLWGPP